MNATLRFVTPEETGAEHCQHDNPTIGQELMADWLADRFGIDQRRLAARALAPLGDAMAAEMRWPTDRLDYSPITARPPLPLPDGARIVVWPCVNVEHWAIDQPMPRTVVNPPGGVKTCVPDLPNWAWHEYGQRVGFWRLKQIFDEFGVAGSLMMNASVCDVYPQIVDACLASAGTPSATATSRRRCPRSATSAR